MEIEVKRERDNGFGDFRDFEVERGRELVLLFRGSNFGLYSEVDFLTKMADVGFVKIGQTISGLSAIFPNNNIHGYYILHFIIQ